MAHGLSGRPKSEQHKRRISEGVKRAARKHESDLWAAKFQLSSLLAQKEYPTAQALQDAFVKALMKAVKATSSAMDVAEAQWEARLKAEAELYDELYDLRGKLHRQGGNLQAMDSLDLSDAAQKGLVDQEEVRKEMERRRRAHGYEGLKDLGNFGVISNGAAVGGYLWCGEHGCNRQVPAEEGAYCPEHKKAQPRSWISAGFQARNLDFELSNAELRLTKARRESDQAAAEVADLQTQIRRYDAAHRPD